MSIKKKVVITSYVIVTVLVPTGETVFLSDKERM